jgi:fucose permease
LFCLVFAFWNETASRYRQNKQADSQDNKTDTKAIFRYSATWICAAYFLAYVGTETAISGWVVSFMLRTRNATPYLAGICSTGFWMGMAIGRLVLGFVTDRIGVRRATALYFVCAIGLEVLFALLKFQVVSAILMTLLGFIMGPLFPSGVVILTRLLPVELHVAAVSFVSSLGQIGGAFFPFAIGAVVQSLGIGVFRFAILAQTVSALVLWLGFARVRPTVPTINTRENDTRED